MIETTDQLIDRALGLSAQAQPSAGMQQRVVANVESHRLTSDVSVFDFLKRRTVWQIPVASLFAAAVVIALVRSHPGQTNQQIANVIRPSAEKPSSLSKENEHLSVRPLTLSIRKPASDRAGRASTSETQHLAVQVKSAAVSDDAHTPSRPAPDMPLTTQEQILLHAVHHNDSVLLAQLQSIDESAVSGARRDLQGFLKQLVAPMTSGESYEDKSNSNTSAATQPETEDLSQQTQPTSTSINGDSQ